ncbi:MAG TPA: methyltransferase domain-containing protein [Thermomicrobiales bacterium]|nr:methyltransferase domain-containing protein [Thermomicrobiales bacterium]
MSQVQRPSPLDGPSAAETYTVADREVQESYVGTRTAAEWVPFFLPHLRPGMSLLDCGCGVGSITLDLAERVAPGPVVGVDIDVGQLALARAEAERRGLTNVRFEVASIYDLPFPDASFDAALAHTLLIHLREPLRALRVLRRMLKPGGVICVSDDDVSTRVLSPADPLVVRLFELFTRLMQYNGGSPFYARNLRGLMLEAGFARTEGHAVAAERYGTLAETRNMVRLADLLLSNPAVIAPIVSERWADEAELARIRAATLAWGERPDAFCAWMYCAAVGWME